MLIGNAIIMEEAMTLEEYIKAKIDMLTDDFKFNLDRKDILKLETARSELQCDQIAHDLFNKYM